MGFFSKIFGNKKDDKSNDFYGTLRICEKHKVLALKVGAAMIIFEGDNSDCARCTYRPVNEAKALKIMGLTEKQLLTGVYECYQSRNPNSLYQVEKKIKEQCEKRLKLETEKQELEYFEKMYTNNPQEAVSVLFDHAMAAVPEITPDKVKSYFNSVKGTFGSKVLVEGPKKKVSEALLFNLIRLATATDFQGFSVDALTDSECAQINISFKRTFTPFRIWKTKKAFYACGDPNFK